MELNKLYNRNIKPEIWEDNPDEVNCGSFALDVDEWYCPYIEDDCVEDELYEHSFNGREELIKDMIKEGQEREEIMERIIDLDFAFILQTCPWLEATTPDEYTDEDRVIAYRLSLNMPPCAFDFDADADMDFHFRVFKDGEWWEKNGGGPIHLVEDVESEIWEIDDWLIYDGPIRYAKFKKEKNR